MIDQDLILKLFLYDPETGIFKRIGRLKRNGSIINFRKTEEVSRNFSKDHFKRKVWNEDKT